MVFLKSTTSRELAFRLRDFSDEKIKNGEFREWFEDFVASGRNMDFLENMV